MSPILTALLGAVILAGVFWVPFPREVVDERQPGFRSLVSFAAGMSVAYVFVDLLPELAEASEHVPEYFVTAAALVGFVAFYGLERLVRWAGGGEDREGEERVDYRIKVAGLAGYAGLVVYLLVTAFRGPSEEQLWLYLVAMVFHFIAMRHSLRYEHPAAYDAHGRFVLAGACLAGWAVGWFIEVPATAESLLLGFLGGMLIMNTTVMELPSEKEGRFGMFALGSALYAVLLIAA